LRWECIDDRVANHPGPCSHDQPYHVATIKSGSTHERRR
jgi:hypothetical protein